MPSIDYSQGYQRYMCVKHFLKHTFLGDLGECHHLEITTLRLHLGSGNVFRQRCKYSPILFNDCSIRVFYCLTVLLEYLLLDCSIGVYQSFWMNKICYGHFHGVLRTTYPLGFPLVELDALLRVMKEITNIILLFLFHYIQTHAYIIHVASRTRILSHTRMGQPIRVWDIPYAYGHFPCPIRVWASRTRIGPRTRTGRYNLILRRLALLA